MLLLIYQGTVRRDQNVFYESANIYIYLQIALYKLGGPNHSIFRKHTYIKTWLVQWDLWYKYELLEENIKFIRLIK